jgi:hypothetical protein
MLQMDNKTPFKTSLGLFPDEKGIDSVYPVVKGTFQFGEKLRIADDQAPIVMVDEFHGKPDESSLKYSSELTFTKPATDVVLMGHAYAPRGRKTTEVDVGLRVGRHGKVIRVFGNRLWLSGAVGHMMSAPQPFERMPLVYERSFGGNDHVGADERPVGVEQNPVGTGYYHSRGKKEIGGMPLPNLEDPLHLISGWTDAPAPVGFGPLCAHWAPRKNYAGTYDEAWQANRAPYLPLDFDPRFFNSASPDMIFSPHLQGGEDVEIHNADPSGRLAFKVPRMTLDVSIRIDGQITRHTPTLDTVIIEPDDNRYSLIWRCKQTCDKKMLRIEQVAFAIKQADPAVAGL